MYQIFFVNSQTCIHRHNSDLISVRKEQEENVKNDSNGSYFYSTLNPAIFP